jgi:hypothetical protein
METPSLAFIPDGKPEPGIEILVNFGIFAGRAATPAEIDRLAEWLLDAVDSITVVSEERHEIGGSAEASVHQVRIQVAQDGVPSEASARRALEDRLLERADYWARTCVAVRPDNTDDDS